MRGGSEEASGMQDKSLLGRYYHLTDGPLSTLASSQREAPSQVHEDGVYDASLL